MRSDVREGAVPASFGRLCLGVAALAGLCLCAGRAAAGEAFDWRDVGGHDYTTPVKSQLQCGSCWAFAAVGALEAKLEITTGRPDWNPDLSEQHLLCDGSCGSCSGGWEYRAIAFFRNTGVVTEAELPYCASDTSPDWPLEDGWEDRVCRITAYQSWLTCTTENLKWSLETYGPLVAAMLTEEDWYWPVGAEAEAPQTCSGPVMTDVEGIDHAVVVVGYEDHETLAGGGYWIVKNSWGPAWGDNGYGYILYGDLESHNRVHAITGEAYLLPEPFSLAFLALGAVALLKRRPPRRFRTYALFERA